MKPWLLAASALALVGTARAQSAATPPAQGIALSALYTYVGIDTHFDDLNGIYPGTTGYGLYGNLQAIESALAYLGPKQIRDGIPSLFAGNYNAYRKAATLEQLSLPANGGYQFTLVAADSDSGIATERSYLDQTFAGVGDDLNAEPPVYGPPMASGAVVTIEGLNEITNESPQPSLATATAWQRSLLCLTRNESWCNDAVDPHVAGATVAEFTSNGPVVPSGSPSYAFPADFINAHPYAAPSNAYGETLIQIINGAFASDYDGVQPVPSFAEAGAGYTLPPGIMTESGAYAEPADATRNDLVYLNSYDDATVAIKDLDDLLDGTSEGVRTFLYQLFDNYPASIDSDNVYGLFRTLGQTDASGHAILQPTPAAIAIHNLYAIAASAVAGASVDTGSNCLPHTVGGLPPGAFTMMIKLPSTGGYAIVLWWDNPADWNKNAHAEVPVTAVPVVVTFADTVYGDRFDPIASASAVGGIAPTRTIALQLGDHPIVLGLVSENANDGSCP